MVDTALQSATLVREILYFLPDYIHLPITSYFHEIHLSFLSLVINAW